MAKFVKLNGPKGTSLLLNSEHIVSVSDGCHKTCLVKMRDGTLRYYEVHNTMDDIHKKLKEVDVP